MSEALPDEFWHGMEQFNQREFYACHDTLEALWIEATEPEKKFYQGILQVAVALYHLSNQNWRGAVILMGEGMNRLRGYQPSYAGIDVEEFLAQTIQLFKVLQQTGPDQVTIVMQTLGLPLLQPGSTENRSSAVPLDADDLDPESLQRLAFPTLQRVSTQLLSGSNGTTFKPAIARHLLTPIPVIKPNAISPQ